MLLFSCKGVSDSLQPHGLQDGRLLCPPLSPGVCSNSCPLSQWYYLTISSSVAPFSFCLQSFPVSQSFSVSRLFASGGQSDIGASASTSVLPMNMFISIRFDGFNRLSVQRSLKSLLQHCKSKALILWCSAFMVQLSHPNKTTGKSIALFIWTFVSKVMSLLFITLFIFVLAFLPRSKHLLIPAVTVCSDFGAQENKICHCFHLSPSISHEVMLI